MWYIYMMEYYSATKKNEIMPFTVTWMDSQSVILSEISQTKKEKYRMASLISDQISRSVVSDSLRPHESQHARPPCPSPTPGVHSDACPSSQ